jgi:hypothetical protein
MLYHQSKSLLVPYPETMHDFFDYIIRHHQEKGSVFGSVFGPSPNLNRTLSNLNRWFSSRFGKIPELNRWSGSGFGQNSNIPSLPLTTTFPLWKTTLRPEVTLPSPQGSSELVGASMVQSGVWEGSLLWKTVLRPEDTL